MYITSVARHQGLGELEKLQLVVLVLLLIWSKSLNFWVFYLL